MPSDSLPSSTISARHASSKTMCARDFVCAKNKGHKLSIVTCYDYTFACLLAMSPIDGILVGDSVGMVMHGHSSTLSVTVDLMRLHTQAVVRGAAEKFVIVDMPFLSFRKGLTAAMNAVQTLITAGAHAVKIEGIDGHEKVIEQIVQSGIPVMGHLGMQPQSVRAYGGFRVQGRTSEGARAIVRQASALEDLGVFAIVLECIPANLAQEITAAVRVPTIGIGAGPNCDGQVLVLQDLLGLNLDLHPKFSRSFQDGARHVLDAIANFDEAVRAGTFPAKEESY